MHDTQERILALLESKGQLFLKYAQIGRDIHEKHIQNVKYHLAQLEKRGYIEIDYLKKVVKKVQKESSKLMQFSSIPFYGTANCGSALSYADDVKKGVLKVSSSIIGSPTDLIAVQAVGNSMNNANINGRSIEDGDYVIIDTQQKSPRSGDYVLSVIDDGANIKRLYFDEKNGYVVLRSESNDTSFHDIIIDESDHYSVVGVVKMVIKKPQIP